MRVLILGGDGMLGHQLLEYLENHYETRVTLRHDLSVYRRWRLFHQGNAFSSVDVLRGDRLLEILANFHPQAVVNAVGIVKQRAQAKEPLPTLEINALFPHRLALLCRACGARLIHISTDCVFSGRRGGYIEDDPSDAEDLYGRSKFLGEVIEPPCVTLRTSIIGLELARRTGLIEWFLAQRGAIKGFKRAIYTGLTTLEMARVIQLILTDHPDLYGVWQVSSSPVTKYELLTILAVKLNRTDIKVEPDETFVCDRSLSGRAFEKRVGYQAPSWNSMLSELAQQIVNREQQESAQP